MVMTAARIASAHVDATTRDSSAETIDARPSRRKGRARRLAIFAGALSAIVAGISGAAEAWPPKGSFVIAGDLKQPTLVATADVLTNLHNLPIPAYTLVVSFQGPNGLESHSFGGVLLYDALTLLVPNFNAAVKNDKLRFHVTATGSDAYEAIVGWGEIDPAFENKSVLLAVIQDGQPLTQPRLVVPGDIHGGRYVSDVVSVRLGRVPDDPVIQFLPIGQ